MPRSIPIYLAALGLFACQWSGCVRSKPSSAFPSGSLTPAQAKLLPSSDSLRPFRLSDITERRFSQEFTFTNSQALLKLESFFGLGPEGAEAMVKDGLMGVQALYANALSPYPGDISKQVVLDARFRPQMVQTNWGDGPRQYLLLFANDRFAYGATTPDSIRYRSLLGWFYCDKADLLFKVRFFGPPEARNAELVNVFRALQCPHEK